MSKFLVTVAWADVPHLSEQEQAEQLAAIPPYQRDARTKGIPYLGSGAIYPFDVSDITVQDFRIPDHWPRGYGMDVGWNRTAAVWLAHDRETDEIYLYSVHSRGHAEPEVHAAAIKARGEWIPGMIDPASRGRSQSDGQRLFDVYKRLGLHLHLAPNAVEAGILSCTIRYGTGRLKIFTSCTAVLEELTTYSRNEHGKVIKEADHAMDAKRYGVQAIEENANWLKTAPVEATPEVHYVTAGQHGQEWMGG